MTATLQRAFTEAAKLSEPEQDLLASQLLAELVAENAFDQTLAATGHRLSGLAATALAEHQAGQTEALDPEAL